MIRRAPLALALLAAACAGGGQDAARRGPPGVGLGALVAIDEHAMREHTRTLASDSFEGRKPGTPGEERTVAYIAAEMEKAGLQPGVAGGWFQSVPIVETRLAPFALALGGGARGRLAHDTDVLAGTRRTTSTVALKDSPVVFAGYGIVAPEHGWDDYAGLDVRGKTVIVLVNDPDWRLVTGPFGGRAMSLYGRWDYKHDEAARHGAAAVLVVHGTAAAGYGWNVIRTSWGGPQLSAARDDGGAGRPAFEGWISAEAAGRLLKTVGLTLAEAEARAATRGFRAVALPVTLTASAKNATRAFTSRNVVGVLPGRARPAETVLYTAHWDHLGRCGPAPGGAGICSGAVDNATGVAALLALAEAHARAGPAARSLAFVAVTGEESGLIGSEYYARHPVFPLATTVGGINMDGLNVIGRTSDVVVVGAGKSELEPLFAAAAARQSRRVEPEPTPEKGYYYRSDHFSLAKVGVPMLYAKSGVDVRGRGVAYGQAAQADYTANRYHQPADKYDETWDWSGAVEDVALYYNVGRTLASGRGWPNWLPGAEFRAARDTSRAGQPAVPADPEPPERGQRRAR